MLRPLALAAAGSLLLTSCLVGNPAPGDLAARPDAEATHTDIAYGGAGGCEEEVSDTLCGGSQLLDIYPSEGGRSRGTIVWIHGGGLFLGDKSELQSAGPVFEQLERGWSVVSVNYRLLRPADTTPAPSSTTTSPSTSTTAPAAAAPTGSTSHPTTPVPATPLSTSTSTSSVPDDGAPPPEEYDNAYPAAVQDVVAAIEWVRRNGSAHGLDTSHLVLAGHSAGGMLAAMVGLGWNSEPLRSLGARRPDAWITMAAPMDLGSWDTAEMMSVWLGPRADELVGRLSPINSIDAADPPGYVAHGDRDNVVSMYHAKATEFVYGLKGLAAEVRVDIVDRDSSGTSMGPGPRWHVPGEGVGMKAFNDFMDSI